MEGERGRVEGNETGSIERETIVVWVESRCENGLQ